MHDYVTYFDATHEGWHTWPPLLIPLLLAALFAWMFLKPFSGRRKSSKLMGGLGFVFCMMMTALVFYTQYNEYISIQTAAAANGLKTVEGTVEHFIPMPYNGHAQEHFCVKDVCFAYSDFSASSGFSRTASHGGPIHEGLQVRISYLAYDAPINAGNIIVRLEIRP